MKLKLSQACMLVCQQRPGLFIRYQSIAMAGTTTILLKKKLNYFTYIYMQFQFATVKSSFSVVSLRLLHCKWYESTRILRGNIHFILYTWKRKTTYFKKIRGNFNWFLCLKMLKSTNASSSHSLHSISEFITDDNTNERTIFWS